jgi:hypothetical protein
VLKEYDEHHKINANAQMNGQMIKKKYEEDAMTRL